MWWNKRVDLMGSALFPGRMLPALESLEGLRHAGIEVRPEAGDEATLWAATLNHPTWGEARLVAPRESRRPPDVFLDFDPSLSPAERERLSARAGCAFDVQVPAREGDVLADRKRFLRYMAAILGNDGEAAFDVTSMSVWTRDRLADELSHDAVLDIVQIFALHAVERGSDVWLHTHGFGELGFVDFDILRPADALVDQQYDIIRSIAFSVVEGERDEVYPVQGADPVKLVPASSFMSQASAADRALRDPDGHTERRVVCCDARPPGFLARLFGAKGVGPSALLSRGMDEGRHLVAFSHGATDLMAARARETLGLFAALTDEFRAIEATPLAKIGYVVDGGGPTDREHLWFEVHGVSDAGLDATLLNDPFRIERMAAGQRSLHSVDQLTDWTLMTPVGQITPRRVELVRPLREHMPEILEAMRRAPQG